MAFVVGDKTIAVGGENVALAGCHQLLYKLWQGGTIVVGIEKSNFCPRTSQSDA